MSNFKAFLNQATEGEKPDVLGVVALALDKTGKEIISYTSGKTDPNGTTAKDVDEDSLFVLASCTKLITSITALKLVQSNILSLDDPELVEKHLPDLTALEVLTSAPGQEFTYEKRKKGITLRHLLTHTSGSGYDILDPRLAAWRQARGEAPIALTAGLPEAIATPSIFQPGEGWAYGGSLCWAGLLIERVSGQTLGETMRKEVFEPLGCDNRIGFESQKVDKTGDVAQIVTRAQDGALTPFPQPPQICDRGGGGLISSAKNFGRVLADLISPEPKVLKPEMLDVLFSAQLQEGGTSLTAFRQQSKIFTGMTGALTGTLPASSLNYALGGLLITEDNLELGKTKGTMAWGGAFNCFWFANRNTGIAAFFGSSMFPPGDPKTSAVMGEFVREVWSKVKASEQK